jgi:hypothetical protein
MVSGEGDFLYEDFVRSRKLHWMQEAKKTNPELAIPSFDDVAFSDEDSSFFVSCKGPRNLHAVFEDAGETGWLYIYDSSVKGIITATHVYNRGAFAIDANDVDIAWSRSTDTCCVAIWEQIRAFLGTKPEIAMRKPIRDRESSGFHVDEWPDGFAYLLAADSK